MAKKITWEDKEHILPYGTRENQVWDLDMNEIKTVVNANADSLAGLEGGYQGVLLIADTPVNDGYYIAGESGTYTNAGGLVVDLTDTITFINKVGVVYTKTEIPLTVPTLNAGTLDPASTITAPSEKTVADYTATLRGGTVASGETKDVSGGEVYNVTAIRTVLSLTNPTPNFIGQLGYDANGNKYEAISLTGNKWELADKTIYNIFRKGIDNAYSGAMPLSPFKAINITELTDTSVMYRDGVLKDLYIVYFRKGTLGGTSTIIQIGEKIGSSVGLNLNLFASISVDVDTTTTQTLRLLGTGVQVEMTIDFTLISATYNLTTQAPLNVQKLLASASNRLSTQAYNKKLNSFWKNPTNTTFDYNSILKLELISGDPNLLYTNGVIKELYLTYFRFVGLGSNPPTNIIQIAWKDGATVGYNNKIFATVPNDTRDMSLKPIASFDLIGSTTLGLDGIVFRLTIDLAKIPSTILASLTLSNSLQLDVFRIIENYRALSISQPLLGKKIVCFGDSVTEFGTYPEQIAPLTGATTYKIGFGGCHLAQRSDSADYNELGMVKVAESVASQNFTSMSNAVTNLANLPTPDDNTVAFNKLVAIDFNTVDFVTIFYGTNDFTGNKVIGASGSANTFEIKGAVNYIVNTLLTAYPQLKILFITPTHRYFNISDDSDLLPNSIGKYLIEYCDAIETESEVNHTPTLNMYRKGGLNKYNHYYYFDVDNVHPNAIGDTYLAQKISAKLISLFKTN